MPVQLTDHVDRNLKPMLGRGKIGRVHSIDWAEGAPQPRTVWVHFEDCGWRLPGTSLDGLYPIVP
eukprot:6853131-Prorocentrum_lima.AAC.1